MLLAGLRGARRGGRARLERTRDDGRAFRSWAESSPASAGRPDHRLLGVLSKGLACERGTMTNPGPTGLPAGRAGFIFCASAALPRTRSVTPEAFHVARGLVAEVGGANPWRSRGWPSRSARGRGN